MTTSSNMASTTERKESAIENNNTSSPVTASACPQVPKQYSIYGYNTYAMIRPPTSAGPVTAGSGPLNGVNHHQNGPLYSQPPPPLPYRPPPPNPYNTPPSSYNGRGGIPMQGKMDEIACTQIELSFLHKTCAIFPNYVQKALILYFYVSADHSPVGFRPSPTHMRLSPSPPASSTTSNGGQSTSTPPPTYARVSNLKKNHGNSPTRNVRYIQNH